MLIAQDGRFSKTEDATRSSDPRQWAHSPPLRYSTPRSFRLEAYIFIAASAAAADSSEASANFISNGADPVAWTVDAEWAECTDATVLMDGILP